MTAHCTSQFEMNYKVKAAQPVVCCLSRMVFDLSSEHADGWDVYLPASVYQLCCTVNPSTCQRPLSLLHSRAASPLVKKPRVLMVSRWGAGSPRNSYRCCTSVPRAVSGKEKESLWNSRMVLWLTERELTVQCHSVGRSFSPSLFSPQPWASPYDRAMIGFMHKDHFHLFWMLALCTQPCGFQPCGFLRHKHYTALHVYLTAGQHQEHHSSAESSLL